MVRARRAGCAADDLPGGTGAATRFDGRFMSAFGPHASCTIALLRERERILPPLLRTIRVVVAALIAFAAVAVVHGNVPGLLNTSVWDYLLEGDMRCLDGMGSRALTSWCDAYGLPLGYPFYSSGPIVAIGWALMTTTGMGSRPAYLISGMGLDAVALAGAYWLLRLLGVRRSVALVGSVAYLVSPTLVGLRDLGGTFTAVALLPGSAAVDLTMMRVLGRASPRVWVMAVAAYAAFKAFMLFLDGYGFVLSAVLSLMLWLWWLVRGSPARGCRLLAFASMLAAQLGAVALYRLYVPGLAGAESQDVFRSMGADASTFLVPSKYVWWAALIGVKADPSKLWGDGTNAGYNYLGVWCTLLAAAAFFVLRRRAYVLAIGAAGLVALVLSLGPSLKVRATRPAPRDLAALSYAMPAAEATARLPWDGVFHLPGVSQMRATYRWSALGRLALIVLAAMAIDELLARSARRWLVAAAGVAALAGLTPNVPLLVSEYRAHARSRAALDADLTGDLKKAVRPGERVFFLSPDGTFDDYLINYLAPTAKFRALNAGGDKNAGASQRHWPAPVAALAGITVRADDVVRALNARSVDAVVLPYFHLRWAAYAWPPSARDARAARRRFAPVARDARLDVRRYPWFAVARIRR